jgi:DNA-binding MarR family transcriptional regulator
MHDIFFQEKSKLILLALMDKEKYISEIATEVKSTYAHTFNLLRTMEDNGIVKAKKDGRTKYVRLTPRGSKLAEVLMKFESILTPKLRRTPAKKKRNEKTHPRALTPTAEKLQRYSDSLSALIKELDSRSRRKNLGKYARLTGRYRSLTSKLRPKDKAGKKMKREVLQLLDEIKSRLDMAKEEK